REAELHSREECRFWRFSLKFYSRAGVQEVLLEAQDRCGADVNMLLFALWQAGNGHEVWSNEFAALNAATADWRSEVMLPLRTLRRFIQHRNGVEFDCYEQAKALELACERAQQIRMYETSTRFATHPVIEMSAEELSVTNLKCYVQSVGAN